MVILNIQNNFHTQGDVFDGKHRTGEGLSKPTWLHVVTLSSFHTFIHPGDNESHSQYSALSLGICVPKLSLGTDWASLGIAGCNEMKETQP